jgi:hypothetical protein
LLHFYYSSLPLLAYGNLNDMASQYDLNSSWDALDSDDGYNASSLDDNSPMDSPPQPKRRSNRISDRGTPTSSRRGTPRAVSTSTDAAQSFVMPSPYSPPNTFSPRKPARRTTPVTQPVRESTPTRRVSRTKPTPQTKKERVESPNQPETPSKKFQEVASQFGISALDFSSTVFWDMLGWLRPFISFILAFLFLIGLVIYALQTARSYVPSLPSFDFQLPTPSICSLPLISHLSYCSTDQPYRSSSPEFENLVKVQDELKSILDLSEATSLFPYEFDRTESPIIELRDVIKWNSQLPSKADLMMQLDQFITFSRSTKADLTSFSVHLGGSYDKIVSMNRHTLQVLDRIIKDEDSQSTFSKILGTFTGSSGTYSEADVVRQYLRHADTVEGQTDALILEGQNLLIQLENLDSMLDVIRETANRDLAELKNSKDELFSSLWTFLGGNSVDKKRLNRNIAVAEQLKDTRTAAAAVVRKTIEELRRVKNGLIDVTARVAIPRNRGHMDRLEIEEHVRYVTDGLERLYTARLDGLRREKEGMDARIGYVNRVFENSKDGGTKYQFLGLDSR